MLKASAVGIPPMAIYPCHMVWISPALVIVLSLGLTQLLTQVYRHGPMPTMSLRHYAGTWQNTMMELGRTLHLGLEPAGTSVHRHNIGGHKQ